MYFYLFISIFLNSNSFSEEIKTERDYFFWLSVGPGMNRNLRFDKIEPKVGNSKSISFSIIHKNQIFTFKNNHINLLDNDNSVVIEYFCEGSDFHNDLSLLYGYIIKLDNISFSISSGLSYLSHKINNYDINSIQINCDSYHRKYSFGIPIEYSNMLYLKHVGLGFNFYFNYNQVQSFMGINFCISVGSFK